MQSDFLTLKEVCEFFKISRRTAYNLMAQGKLVRASLTLYPTRVMFVRSYIEKLNKTMLMEAQRKLDHALMQIQAGNLPKTNKEVIVEATREKDAHPYRSADIY